MHLIEKFIIIVKLKILNTATFLRQKFLPHSLWFIIVDTYCIYNLLMNINPSVCNHVKSKKKKKKILQMLWIIKNNCIIIFSNN